jgi:ATP-dependent Clp protease ATP-binding subunit ClpB
MAALRKHFRPEFVQRIDDLIIFHALGRKQMGDIARIQLKRVENLLADQKISVEITPAACEKLVEIGYDPMYGARPIKRAIQREIENPLATKILENTFIAGDTIVIDRGKSGLTFSKKNIVKVSAPSTTTVQLVESAEG